MSYQLVYSDRFNASVADFRQQDSRYLAELMEVLTELSGKPFGNPKLQSHGMKGVSGEKRFITYVGGSRGRRLIWSRFGRSLVLLLFGEHDVEQQAERLEIIREPSGNTVTLVERVAGPDEGASVTADEDDPGQLFMAWTDQELRQFGFGDHEVPILRHLDTEEELLDLQLSDSSFELAYNLLAYQDPAGAAAERADADAVADIERTTRELRPEEHAVDQAVRSPAARKHFLPVSATELEELLAAPVEDWMIFLHPDQATLTQRPFSGPARVRGGAGTGKTVVGLHRARHLADAYGDRVLFTTYVRNLPPVFAQLFARLTHGDDAGVEFSNLHKVAYRLVAQADGGPNIDVQTIDAAFASAWGGVAEKGSELKAAGLTRSYLREELDWVIKGRGLVELDRYLELARTGRGTGLAAPARREAWALYEEYQRQLARRQLLDFNDVINRAIELLVLGRATSPYRSVVVDEAQDLTEMGLRLAYQLAGGDRRDGLFLLGDGQQSVYPGGVSLGQLGIDVRGRSTLLRVNYRNPRRVLALANQLLTGERIDDLDSTATDDEREDTATTREGDEPILASFDTVEDHDAELLVQLEELAARPDTGLGDVAILVPTNRLAKDYESVVTAMGLRAQNLSKYEGLPTDAVKVGTYQRAKGLEFKQVLLPRLDSDGLGESARPGEDEATHQERLELLRRQIYVAITRARDGVWLGSVGGSASLLSRAPYQQRSPASHGA